MSLLDEIDKKVNVKDYTKIVMQKKMALLHQLNDIMAEQNISHDEIEKEMEELGEEDFEVPLFFSAEYDPTLEEIAKLESVLGEDLFKVKRNVDFEDKD